MVIMDLALHFTLLFCFCTAFGARIGVKVTIKNGPLVGEQRDGYVAFEGIPYAKAPIGERRFAASELNDERWVEPRNVSRVGAICMQWSHFKSGVDKLEGEEDCLFLNVYTPDLAPEEPLPTIVHLHGGAFMYGGGGYFQPDFLLTRPLVLVTVNYRLGPLGFLSTGDDVISGNFGLKDQRTALQWVQRNIKYFGGDPNRVSLSGFSAGSASVHLHYLSPLSRGLFASGIAHSGSALNPWVMVEQAAEKAKIIAAALGCPTGDSEALLACMRLRPAEEIVRQVPKLQDYLYNPFSPLGVVVESSGPRNPDPFLTNDPRKLTREGSFQRVPLILSVTEAEGLYPGAEFLGNERYVRQIDDQWNDLLPSILDYKYAVTNRLLRNALSEVIRDRYLGKAKLNEQNYQQFTQMLSNRLFFAGVTETARLMQPYIPVYLYFDQYKASYGLGEAITGSQRNLGVAHGEDLLLILPSSLRDGIPYTAEEMAMVSQFVDLYESFAYGRTPRFGTLKVPALQSPSPLTYLAVNYPNSTIVTNDQLSDEAFWDVLDFNDGTAVQDYRLC